MRRFVPLLIAGAAMIAAACRDAIAPTRSVSETALVVSPTGGMSVRGGNGAGKGRKGQPPTSASVASFSIPAAGGTLRVGDFWLTFPESSVCDPATSGYGKRLWDKPCETLGIDFPIVATYWWENGEAYVEFSPDIRFDPTKVVLISSYRPALIGKTAIGEYQLWYWTQTLKGRQRHDEAAVDRSVRSLFDPATGQVFRRIKHFSGISLSSGMACDETTGDPDCEPTTGTGDY